MKLVEPLTDCPNKMSTLTAFDIYNNYRLEGFKSQTVDNILNIYPYATFAKRNKYNEIVTWLKKENIKNFDFIASRDPYGTVWFFDDENIAIVVSLKWM